MFYGSYIGFGGHSGEAAYPITNAVYFDGSADYLTKTFSSTASSNTDKTISFWVKRAALGSVQWILDVASNGDQIQYTSGDALEVSLNATTDSHYTTKALFRDPTAWTHIVIAFDTDSGTAANKKRLWINGVLQADAVLTNHDDPADDANVDWMKASIAHNIGRRGNNSQFFGGYLAEFIGIDGTAYEASNFGKYDINGVWVPKSPSALTFGTNGFHLDFKSANIGTDASGNGNDFTVASMGVANNVVVDTCTDDLLSETTIFHGWELATSDQAGSWGTPSQELGGTKGGSSSGASYNLGTLALTSGKYYWRVQITQESSGYPAIGVHKTTATPAYDGGYIAGDTNGWCILTEGTHNGKPRHNGSNASAIHTYSNGDYVDVALDMDNGKIWFGRNGTFDGDPAAGSGEAYSSISGSLVPSMSTSTSSYGIIDVSGGTPPTGYSQYTETITGVGNFCTWNAVETFPSGNAQLSNGNRTTTMDADSALRGTHYFDVTDSTGYYWETTFTANVGNASHVGISVSHEPPLSNTSYRDTGVATYLSDGGSEGTWSGGLGTTGNRASGGTHATYTAGDTIGVAVKGGAIWFSKNGSWIDGANGGASSSTVLSEINSSTTTNAFFHTITGVFTSTIREHNGTNTTATTNWGQQPFKYTPPTNMKRLMTADLPAPTVKNPDDGFVCITLEDGDTIEASLATARAGWGSFIDVFFRETDGEDRDVRFSDDSGNSMHFNTTAAKGSEATLSSSVNYSAFSWRVGADYGCYTAEISHTNGATTNQAHGLGSGVHTAVAKRSDSTGDWYISHPNLSSANCRFNVQEVSTSELVTVGATNVTLNSSFASGTYRVIVWKQIDGFSAFLGYDHNGSTTDGPYLNFGGSASLVLWRNIDSSNSNDFFSTFPKYSSQGVGSGNPTDIRYNWGNQEKGYSGITIGDVTANGYKMRPSSGGAFGSAADDPMLVWAWGLRPFGGSGVEQGRAK